MRGGADPESDAVAGTDANAGRGTGSRDLNAARVTGTVEFSRRDRDATQAGVAMCLRAFVEAEPL